MAIEVDTSKDIREYKINNIGPFNNRQIVCIGLSLIYSVPLAAMMPFSTENKVLFGLIIAFPVAACGFIKLDGCYFEVLRNWCRVPNRDAASEGESGRASSLAEVRR